MRIAIAAGGPADPDVVWKRYIEPTRWPSWSPQILGVDYPGQQLREDTAGAVHGLFGLTLPFRILAVDEASRTWTWRVCAPLGIEMTLDHGVEPAGTGTRTTLAVDGPAPVVLAYVPLARVALGRLVRS